MEKSVAEAVAVIKRLEIDLIYPDPVERIRIVTRATAENKSSMLQDVRDQRQTEIGSINGAIAGKGRRVGLTTPVNETMTQLVRTIQACYETEV